MAAEGQEARLGPVLRGGTIGDPDPAIPARGSEPDAVRAERYAPDGVGVTADGNELLAGVDIPELHGLVRAC